MRVSRRVCDLVFLGNVTVLIQEYDTGVEVGRVRQPSAVWNEEVGSLAFRRSVEHFLQIAMNVMSTRLAKIIIYTHRHPDSGSREGGRIK